MMIIDTLSAANYGVNLHMKRSDSIICEVSGVKLKLLKLVYVQ
jgi:hypothetical protein